MSTTEKNAELEDERTAEKRYEETLRESAKTASQHGSDQWIRPKAPPLSKIPVGRLVGRVALAGRDELLGDRNDFYIGESRSANVDGVEVYNWANAIACAFYRENHNHDAYQGLGELCDDAVVVRSFSRANGQISDFADDVVRDGAPAQPFPGRGLFIPVPPRRASLPSRDVPQPPQHRPVDHASRVDKHAPEASPTRRHRHPRHEATPVRAESALRAQLQAPRTKSLTPVLATLQPDQYELVTLPAMDSTIIEGQPGTGKTIIASHRAAYLINDETPPENTLDGNVLLIGPTTGYSKHVRGIVSRLAGGSDRIKVLSLPELMQRILGLNTIPRGAISTTWRDVDWELGRFARRAIGRLKVASRAAPTTEEAYEYLRRNGGMVATDRDWVRYFRGLPPFKAAVTVRTHSPLLSFIRWQVAAPRDLKGVEHIIVDEAQDVTPLMWFLLDEINEADAWTILGDLNQRRSDHTAPNWAQVLELVAIDESTPIRQLKRGYRSTRPILEFANRLLPRGQRTVFAFQEEGPAPTVEKVRPTELGATLVAHVDRLLVAYPMGTVAVISAEPNTVKKALRARGWAAARIDEELWERDGLEVTVADPDAARGVEFDGVVVVEPADFAQNYGRQGPLYTALTRPNRELAVVYTKSLPDALWRR